MCILEMGKTVLKNLCNKPVTERYPFVKKVYPAGARGQLNIEINKCIFCGICQRKCPTAALAVTKEPKTWTVDRMRCITCGACVDVCPKKCLALQTGYTTPTAIKQKGTETFRP
jgi:formate hydrogenlyase subunit 6/NADH:ubiquinone oxidoreductase subunit I